MGSVLEDDNSLDEAMSVLDDRTALILERRRRAQVRHRGWLVRRFLVVADLLALTAAFVAAALAFQQVGGMPGSLVFPQELAIFVLMLPAWVVVARIYGLYGRDEERTDHSTADDASDVFHMVTVGAWLFYGTSATLRLGHPSLPRLIVFWGLAIALTLGARSLARHLSRRSLSYLQNTVIVGAGEVGQLVARKLLQHPEYGVNLVGFVDAAPRRRPEDLRHLAVLGPPARLPSLVRVFDIERVVVAFTGDTDEQTLDLVRSLKEADVQIDVVPRLFDVVAPGVGVHSIAGVPLVSLPPLRLSRSSRFLKRLMDIVLSAFGLVAFAPPIAVIALLIKADSPGPVFFGQWRAGAGGRPFRMWKFRTMSADAEERKEEVAHLNKHVERGAHSRMFKVPDDPRITRFGRILRRYSLDELPQLVNVLLGEMSLVGPRPLIFAEHNFVTSWARKRVDLNPGMTGVWQVAGRSDIPFDEMVRLDYVYVTNWSLWNDCRLLACTFPAVLRSRGGY